MARKHMGAARLMRVHEPRNDRAVSPVIAVILMVAITVVMSATVYAWVTGFGSQGKQGAKLGLSEVACAAGSSAKFTIVSVSTPLTLGNLRVTDSMNGATTFAISNSGGGTMSAGDVLTVTPTGAMGCTDILNFADKSSNTVVTAIVLHS
ncbi:MAG: archaellin/type IV pilin N-terminal domain-containing protein [Thermoplasmatota archaeon]